MDTELRDQAGIIGTIAFTNYQLTSPRAVEIDRLLRNAHDLPPADFVALTSELRELCPTVRYRTRNIVVLSGREVLARLLAGDTTFSGAVNYGALGTSSTAVDAADIKLGAEVSRKLFARRTRTSNQINFDFFYSQLDTDGTYEEFACFIDGDATADSGQLFNHALTGGWTKTDTEAMTVSVTININAS